jgi:hypothetical protein
MQDKNVINKFDLGDESLSIVQDMDPQGPREWDNMGKMVCWHRRHDLGDKHDFKTPEDFLNEVLSEQSHVL